MKCDDLHFEDYLCNRLDSTRADELERHLESCSSCCDRLRQEAAEDSWWSEAQDFLTTSPWEMPSSDVTRDDDEYAACGPDISFLHPADDPRMLGRLGPYDVQGVVGVGGMGIVLKGFDAALNRYVAIKVLAPALASSRAARHRFAREAQAAAAVVHDHVVPIHGVAKHDGLPYLVMPYIRGESLQRRLDRMAPLAVVEVVRIGMQCASALSAAHAQGLVHRDIKPANILLDVGVERVRITDFGLAMAVDDASLTRTGVVAGTPHFMSPEQARGDSVDHRSDLFSLGSVIYTMLTGRLPFRAETSLAILRRVSDSEPRPIRDLNPEIPTWLVELVTRLHAKQPERRIQTAQELELLLGKCLHHLQDPRAPLPHTLLPSRSWRDLGRWRKHPTAWLMLTTLILFIGLFAWGQRNPSATIQDSPSQQAGQGGQQVEHPIETAGKFGVDDELKQPGPNTLREILKTPSEPIQPAPRQPRAIPDEVDQRLESLRLRLRELRTRVDSDRLAKPTK